MDHIQSFMDEFVANGRIGLRNYERRVEDSAEKRKQRLQRHERKIQQQEAARRRAELVTEEHRLRDVSIMMENQTLDANCSSSSGSDSDSNSDSDSDSSSAVEQSSVQMIAGFRVAPLSIRVGDKVDRARDRSKSQDCSINSSTNPTELCSWRNRSNTVGANSNAYEPGYKSSWEKRKPAERRLSPTHYSPSNVISSSSGYHQDQSFGSEGKVTAKDGRLHLAGRRVVAQEDTVAKIQMLHVVPLVPLTTNMEAATYRSRVHTIDEAAAIAAERIERTMTAGRGNTHRGSSLSPNLHKTGTPTAAAVDHATRKNRSDLLQDIAHHYIIEDDPDERSKPHFARRTLTKAIATAKTID